jgi:peptidoglycan-N-acetylglucosamine deacetylase
VEDVLQRVPGGRLIWRGPTDVRRVALTFDDGPDELTPRYLDVLERYGVAATFFVMGDLTEARPGSIEEYLRHGHQVGSHGYDHTSFDRLRPWHVLDQLARTQKAIGPVPQGRLWVRPPYGAMGPIDLATMLMTGHVVAMWSVDSRDFEEAPVEELAGRCAEVANGDVLLFHEGNEWTLRALPVIIERLQARGFELVTMADLVAV